MAQTISFPTEFSAGVDFSASVIADGFDASVWTVTALFRGPGAFSLTAVGSGTQHDFSAPASTTTSWAPGRYWVSLRASKTGAVAELGRFELVILPDLANQAAGYDGRSQNEIALDAINAVLAKRATIDQQRYTINNRELWRTPMADLLKLRAFYTTQVRRERRRAKGETTFGRAIMVRFSNQ